MKKIMIAAAIVCAAVMGQAASATWSNSGAATAKIKNGSAVWSTLAKENTAVAYLLLASDMTEFKSSLDNGTFGTGKEGDAIGKAVDSTTAINATSGKITSKNVDISTTATDYQMLLVYPDKTSGNVTYQFASSAVTANGPDAEAVPPIAQKNASFAATSFAADGWTAVSVPEPTSGLLLVLGLAGLALRRKQK